MLPSHCESLRILNPAEFAWAGTKFTVMNPDCRNNRWCLYHFTFNQRIQVLVWGTNAMLALEEAARWLFGVHPEAFGLPQTEEDEQNYIHTRRGWIRNGAWAVKFVMDPALIRATFEARSRPQQVAKPTPMPFRCQVA